MLFLGKYLEKPHPATFKHANRQFVAPAAQDHSIKKHNQPKTEKTLNRNKRKMMSKYRKKMAELAEGGISFNLEELVILVFLDIVCSGHGLFIRLHLLSICQTFFVCNILAL